MRLVLATFVALTGCTIDVSVPPPIIPIPMRALAPQVAIATPDDAPTPPTPPEPPAPPSPPAPPCRGHDDVSIDIQIPSLDALDALDALDSVDATDADHDNDDSTDPDDNTDHDDSDSD